MNILINVFGIQDSGGITVFKKLLDECESSKIEFWIYCSSNKNIDEVIEKYKYIKNFHFQKISSKNFFFRLYYENIIFKNIIQVRKIDLVYNFSGSGQYFLQIPQITKVHNLLFYSKKLDSYYLYHRKYFSWIKQIFLKRLIFVSMLQNVEFIEVQSLHVELALENFLDIENKFFFVKSDIDIQNKYFSKPKRYDFKKKIKFLYIVGPHFEYLHKNFIEFTNTMLQLDDFGIDFEIMITLTEFQLHESALWDKNLDSKTSFLGYVDIKKEAGNIFSDNTILISTSIVETLGLHVIEAIQNGVLTIVPNEEYARCVYGKNIETYELFDKDSLANVIKKTFLLDTNEIKDKIKNNQQHLMKNEQKKYKNIIEIFSEILKGKYV